jgi:hypothetical protein
MFLAEYSPAISGSISVSRFLIGDLDQSSIDRDR